MSKAVAKLIRRLLSEERTPHFTSWNPYEVEMLEHQPGRFFDAGKYISCLFAAALRKRRSEVYTRYKIGQRNGAFVRMFLGASWRWCQSRFRSEM